MPYLFVVLFIVFFSIFELDSQNKSFFIHKKLLMVVGFAYTALSLWFIAAFRYKTGADWENYINMYNRSINYNRWYGIEPGFMILNALFKSHDCSFYFMQVVILSFCEFVIFHYFYRNSEKPFVTLFMYLMLNLFFTTDMAQTRQHIAMAIICCGISFIRKRKLALWIITIIFAMQFHITALLAFPLYFSMKYNVSWKTAFIILGITVFISLFGARIVLTIINFTAYLPFIPKRVASILQRYLTSKTEGQSIELASGLGYWGKYIFYIAILLLYAMKNDKCKSYFILNFLIGILFKALGKNFDAFSRIANYYWICGGGLFAYNILFTNNIFFKRTKELQVILCLIFILFHFLLFYKDLNAPNGVWIPYKSFVFLGDI